MKIAKLKNEISFDVEVSFNNKITRLVDCFSLGCQYKPFSKSTMVKVDLYKTNKVKAIESQDVELFKTEYELQKVTSVVLTEQDLELWGNDDLVLYDIVANKLGVEIECVVDRLDEIDTENNELKNI